MNFSMGYERLFGRVNTGVYSFLELGESNVRLGLDDAITDRIAIGVGRNLFQNVYDGLFKYKTLGGRVFGYGCLYIRRPGLPLNIETGAMCSNCI